ncbi:MULTISPECIES: amino acid ABC transporter substrate-binding protein [unclassified Aeromonas]|uniref:amino acid ABC transporter substrate-binding protein n=1 Tax=unclassified Aeromonas TaxID=257493 RepID=UPI001C437BF5|nr:MULTISPECIES: amino acid ABC transporter substrate-binding protein [unclassified Aeromonas]MBV7413525.1 amino acid ABC transporter substrate-binding protein [Aeromonas sp. sif2433]MBV7599020.1 amino acid ABC transporter substrate-binding protein [Aeromonas sp. sia0103]
MKHLRSLFLLAALPLAVMTSAEAQSSLASIQSAGVIKIGTEGAYPPFTYHDKSGKLVGFDVEIGELIASGLGVKPDFVEGKWDGLIAGVDARRYDLVLNEVAITPDRLKKYDFSDPYIISKAVVVVHSDNSSINSFADLRGKKSSQSLTSNFAQLAKASGAEVVATEGFNQSLELVLSGRVDATINDSLSYLDFKKQKPDAKLKVAATEAKGDQSAVLLAKGQPELLAAINQTLRTAKQDGSYQKISLKYFGTDVSQ